MTHRAQEVLYLQLQFYYGKKDTNQNQSKEEMHRVMAGRVSNGKLVMSCPCGVRKSHTTSTLMCSNMQSVANQGSTPKLHFIEFLLGFHFIVMVDSIIGHVIKFSFFCGISPHP